MLKISYHPNAQPALEEIKLQYKSVNVQLGEEFLDEFDRIITGILFMPERWPIVEGTIRRALLIRFPYQIL